MNSLFELEYQLRLCDFDNNLHIRPSSILDIFQEAASIHAMKLGCGLDSFAPKGIGWVLIGVKYSICGKFEPFKKVIIKTWPLKPSGVKYIREYSIVDEDGKVLCVGESLWTIIYLESRKIAMLRDVYNNVDEYIEEKNFNSRYEKIHLQDKEEFLFGGIKKAERTDIDTNGHVNNVKYANFFINCLPQEVDKEFIYVQIDYVKELMRGEEVSLYYNIKDNDFICKGLNGDETIFYAEFKT